MRALACKLSQRLFSASEDRYQPAPKRVLLATDDTELRAELVSGFAKDGHRVVELDDGSELLDYLEAPREFQGARLPPPDVIIAALGMAGVSGLAVLEALRLRGNQTPFIALAEAGDAHCFARVRALEAAFLFQAPLCVDDVRGALFSLPGGAFLEDTLAHAERLQACRRGTQFLRPVTSS